MLQMDLCYRQVFWLWELFSEWLFKVFIVDESEDEKVLCAVARRFSGCKYGRNTHGYTLEY